MRIYESRWDSELHLNQGQIKRAWDLDCIHVGKKECSNGYKNEGEREDPIKMVSSDKISYKLNIIPIK